MLGQRGAYREILTLLDDWESRYTSTGPGEKAALGQKISSLRSRVALSAGDGDFVAALIPNAIRKLRKRIKKLEEAHGIPTHPIRDDTVLPELQRLLDGKVGSAFAPDDLKEATAEAHRRVKAKEPPGFKDAGKDDPTGDYLLWKQCLDEAKSRSMPFLLVSNDQKEDWVNRQGGQTIGPLPALIREARDVAGVAFTMTTTPNFLRLAKRQLDSKVSDTTLEQADAIQPRVARSAGETPLARFMVWPTHHAQDVDIVAQVLRAYGHLDMQTVRNQLAQNQTGFIEAWRLLNDPEFRRSVQAYLNAKSSLDEVLSESRATQAAASRSPDDDGWIPQADDDAVDDA